MSSSAEQTGSTTWVHTRSDLIAYKSHSSHVDRLSLQSVSYVQECFHLTSSIIERDPNAIEAMPLHLAAAYELKKKNELFLCAHRSSLQTVHHL